MKAMELAEFLHRIADDIILAERVKKLSSCNNCAGFRNCMIKPNWGDKVRYNCAYWKGEQHE